MEGKSRERRESREIIGEGETIIIEGNVSAGKSSVVQSLAASISNIAVFTERRYDPYLQPFYEGKDFAACRLQMFILLSQRIVADQMKRSRAAINIVERSPLASMNVFMPLLVRDGKLTVQDDELLKSLYAVGCDWPKAHVIYLRVPPSVCVKRCGLRGNESEHAIEDSYFYDLDIYYERYVNLLQYQLSHKIKSLHIVTVSAESTEQEVSARVEAIVKTIVAEEK